MATVTVTFEILDSELQEGWGASNSGESRTPDQARVQCARSVQARLDEFYGDDGGAYSPEILSVAVEQTGDGALTVDTRGGAFEIIADDEVGDDDPVLYREYRRELRRRGYEVAIPVGTADLEDQHLVHVPTGRFLQGYVSSGAGVDVSLWSDFGAGFGRGDFDTLEQYLDAFEERFADLWREWDAQ